VLQEKLHENKVSRKNQNNKTKFQASQDESYLNTKTFAKHQGKIAVLTSAMQKFFAEQLDRESEIEQLQKQLDILAANEDFSDTYQMLSRKLNNLISEGAWREKELFQMKEELEKLRKRQGYSKIARAFMAIGEDPTLANITTSIIQSGSGDILDNGNNKQPETEQSEPIVQKNTVDSNEFTFGNFSQGEEDKVTDQLQSDLNRIEKEFQALLQTLSKERTAHDQERTSLLNESMELKKESIAIKKIMIDAKYENDKLHDELNSKLQQQQELIRELTEESLRLTRQQLLSPVQFTSQNSAPTVSTNRVSSPIQKMLSNYENLDEETKKHLFQNALLTNNDALQRELMNLQHNKTSSSISLQAKLAKELKKISETYKIPELCFDSKAKMRRSNYFNMVLETSSEISYVPTNLQGIP
jgi:hypothetical protein